MSTDERSLRDKIKDAERATAEIKRHLEHLTEEGLARHSTDNRGRPGVAATCPATKSALGRSGRAARNEVGRFRPTAVMSRVEIRTAMSP
jgi:hypothetical protein